MNRLHMDVTNVSLRNVSLESAAVTGATSGLLPMVGTEFMSTTHTVESRGRLSPDSAGMLASLPCRPYFNRRMFVPNNFRPPSGEMFAKPTPSGDQLPFGPVVKYVDWAAGHFQLERYAQRFRLQASCAKIAEKSGGTQPEDLTVSGAQGRLNKSGQDDDFEDEEEALPIEEDGCSEQQKSASNLKFSIASILGSTNDKRILGSTNDKRKHEKHPDSPTRDCSLSPEPDIDVLADPEQSGNADKETSGDEKALDSLLSDSDRFSWLQCTRYKPPKLPRSKKKDGSKKRKLGRNPRVPFTQHQVTVLEQKFRQTHYLSSVDVAELSAALNLTETRVKIWFQNRRARERRDRENIQLLQSGSTINGSAPPPKPKTPGSDRVSPDVGPAPIRSPRERVQDAGSPGTVGLYAHRLQLSSTCASSIGLAGIAQLASPQLGASTQLAGPQLPPGPWHGPLLPKQSVLAQFAGSHRNSAFTPVTYFSYS